MAKQKIVLRVDKVRPDPVQYYQNRVEFTGTYEQPLLLELMIDKSGVIDNVPATFIEDPDGHGTFMGEQGQIIVNLDGLKEIQQQIAQAQVEVDVDIKTWRDKQK